MTAEADDRPVGREWRWTLASGILSVLLGTIAALLPVIDWAPRAGIVGWLLVLAGLGELAFGITRGTDRIGRIYIVSGLITAAAGLLLVLNPLASYMPVANLVALWLFLRGGWVFLMALRNGRHKSSEWLALSGAVDILLAVALVAGLAIAGLVVALFGPTPEIVAKFSLILAVSFLVTGISQIAIAGIQRRAAAV